MIAESNVQKAFFHLFGVMLRLFIWCRTDHRVIKKNTGMPLGVCLLLCLLYIGVWSQPPCEPSQTFRLVGARVSASAVAIPNRVLFAGGSANLGSKSLGAVVVYTLTTKKNKIVQLSVPRTSLAAVAVGNKAFFGGGGTNQNNDSNVVDVYDGGTNTWDPPLQLSKARQALAATSTGTLAIFAGGITNNSPYPGVDIYDTKKKLWSSSERLSAGRWGLVAASVRDVALFAGGQGNNGLPSDIVDIYNSTSGNWEVHHLSLPRTNLAAAAAGTKIYFAGGRFWNKTEAPIPVDVVDIYDVNTRQWTVATLSEPRELLVGTSWGNWVAFAGGNSPPPPPPPATPGSNPPPPPRPQPSAAIDAFNAKSGKQISAEMSQGRVFLSGVALNNIFFFGFGVGDDHRTSPTVDEFKDLCSD